MRFLSRRIRLYPSLVLGLLSSIAQAEIYDVSTTAELRAALASAATNGEDDTITLAAGVYRTDEDGGGRFSFVSAEPNNLKLLGNTNSTSTINGGGIDDCIYAKAVSDGALLEFESITLTNCMNAMDVPTVFIGTNLTIVDNLATGIVSIADNKPIEIYDSFIARNGGDGISRAISQSEDSTGSPIKIENSTVAHNQGRGIYSNTGSGNSGITATNVKVYENGGLGIYVGYGSNLSLKRTQIYSNDSHGVGLNYNAGLSMDSSSISLNNGSGITAILNGRDYLITNSKIFGNAEWGLQITRSLPGELKIANSVLSNNNSGGISKVMNDSVVNRIEVISSIFKNDGFEFSGAEGDEIFLEATSTVISGDSAFLVPTLVGSREFTPADYIAFDQGDFRLTSVSGLIDAGVEYPELASMEYDYTGTTARVIGGSVDIGPYEYDGEAPPDSDGDGINDNIDNCPTVFNEDQADFDSDGEGDACDSDDDDDGTNDDEDAFPYDDAESLDTDGDGVGNNEDYDDDADGILDSFDNAPLLVNVIVVDTDNDGVIDSVDAYPNDPTKQFSGSSDLDGDGFSNDEEVDYCTNPFDKNSQPELAGLSLPLIQVITEQ